MGIDSTSIFYLHLSRRSYNALRRAGIDTISQLIEAINDESIHSVYGLGSVGYEEIRASIQKHYLKLHKLEEQEMAGAEFVDISCLYLPNRIYYTLRRAGIITVSQLVETINNGSIHEVRNLGKISYQKILESLQKHFPEFDILADSNQKNSHPLREKQNQFETKLATNLFLDNEPREIKRYASAIIEAVEQYVRFNNEVPETLQNELKRIIQLLKDSIITEISGSGFLEDPKFQDGFIRYLTDITSTQKKTEIEKVKLLIKLQSHHGLKDSIEGLYAELTDREINLFLKYTLGDETLEILGRSEGVTRERIRQIITNAVKKLIQAMESEPMAFIYIAIEIGNKLKEFITKDSYLAKLINSGLIEKPDDGEQVFDKFLALIINQRTAKKIGNVPGSFQSLLTGEEFKKTKQDAILATLPRDGLKALRRQISYTGGIQKEDLIQLLEIDKAQLSLVVSALKLTEVISDWLTYDVPEENPEKEPLIRVGILLHRCCGALSTQSFLEGLQRSVSRHYSNLSPNPVVLHYLQMNGFQIVNSTISYSGSAHVVIPKAEALALEIFKKHGPVVTTQQVCSEFQANGYSISMATSKVLPQSPIIEKISQGYYIIRGTDVNLAEHEASIISVSLPSTPDTPEKLTAKSKKLTDLSAFMKNKETEEKVIDGYYQKFIKERENWEPVTPEELDTVWKTIESDNTHLIKNMSFEELERLFFNLFQEVELVGDLPVGIQTFDFIAAKTRAALKHPSDIKKIPPSVFLIGLVFCARYSDSPARNFWTPYVRKVWGKEDVEQSIGVYTRRHFRNTRIDFEKHLGFNFAIETEGELVKPVYQHAIIPSHLQAKFSDWLIDYFEILLKIDQTKLRLPENVIDGIPTNELRTFLTDKDTQETSIRLVEKMLKALTFLNSTSGVEEIDHLFVSQIERNIWKRIYQQIASQPKTAERLRKVAPRLQWVWDCEEDRQVLKLSNVVSESDEKPDTLFILKDRNFDEAELEISLNPGKIEDGRWIILDDLYLTVESPENKQVCIVSDKFDFQKPNCEEEKRIIYENTVPELPDPSFFEITDGRYANRKATINHGGEWLILTKNELEMLDRDNESDLHEGQLSQALTSIGFKHSYRVNLQLPILLQFGDDEPIVIEDKLPADLDPKLIGKQTVPGLSSIVPPIFKSNDIIFEFTLDPNHKSYKNTYLYLSKGKKIETKRLVDLARLGILTVDGKHNSINLQKLLPGTGSYSVNLINNLDMYFPSSFYFSVLPSSFSIDFDGTQVFTPNNLPEITLRGLDKVGFILDHDIVSVESNDSTYKLRWKSIRENSLKIAIQWEGMVVPLTWEIERITAWLEGSSGPQRVDANDITGIRLEIRGGSRQRFQFRVQNTSEEPMYAQLNAAGSYSELLSDTQFPAWTKSLQQVCSEITIDFYSDAWKYFNYWYSPSLSLSKVEYKNGFLTFEINQRTVLRGNYAVYLENETSQTRISILENQRTLSATYRQEIELRPGSYRLVISSFDNPIVKSDLFEVTLATSAFAANDYSSDSDEYISAFLCADYATLKEQYEKCKSVIGLGSIDQIMHVNKISDWFHYREEIYEHDDRMFIKLLPAWAVTSHPLLFEIIRQERSWQVFPERALLGGKVGAGYLDLKIQGQTKSLPIYWFTQPGKTTSEALIYYPPDTVSSKFSEIDIGDMYPMYQCQKCGLVLNPSGSTYEQFPVSVLNFHSHGLRIKKKDVFTDIVFTKHIDVNISQLNNRILWQTYLPSSVIKLSEQGSFSGKTHEFGKVINPYTSDDFNLAVNNEKDSYLSVFRQRENLSVFLNWINESSTNIPALPAWHRLYRAMAENIQIPGFVHWVYSTALLSRMKSRYPSEFAQALNTLDWSLDDFTSTLSSFARKAPLTLEWCTFWAEVFFVHAVS
jgi:hypothetical protein